MRRLSYASVVIAVSVLCACQHGAPVNEKPRVFDKKGGVAFMAGSASWDEDEVLGPLVSVAQRSDGSWAGTINNQVIDVNVYSGRAAGSYLTMKWTQEADKLIVAGAFQDRPYRFEVFPDRVEVRLPTRSFTLQNQRDWTYGPGGELKFEGEAQSIKQPMPQFGLAMLATFLGSEANMRDGSGDPSMPTGTTAR